MPEAVWPRSTLTEPRKLGDERRPRLLVQLLRRPHLLDPAPIEHHHLVGDLERLLLVVRHEQAGHVNLVVQPAEPGAQLVANLRVKRTERLVQQQDLGPRRQRPRQRHPLALAARKLRGIARRRSRSSWTRSSSSSTRSRISALGSFRTFRPNAMFSRTVMWRNSA